MNDIKYQTHLAVLLAAIKLRGKPQEMATFIRKNSEFIPGITNKDLDTLEQNITVPHKKYK